MDQSQMEVLIRAFFCLVLNSQFSKVSLSDGMMFWQLILQRPQIGFLK